MVCWVRGWGGGGGEVEKRGEGFKSNGESNRKSGTMKTKDLLNKLSPSLSFPIFLIYYLSLLLYLLTSSLSLPLLFLIHILSFQCSGSEYLSTGSTCFWASISQRHESGSGSFYHPSIIKQKKASIPTVL